MGMFDNIKIERKLPVDLSGVVWQTHSFDDTMDDYLIKDDGTLWREAYEIEDHSDPNAEGLLALRGMMTRVNRRWERMEGFSGEVLAHHTTKEKWFNVRCWFKNGYLLDKIFESGDMPQPPEPISDEEREAMRTQGNNDQHWKAMDLAAQAELETDPKKKISLFRQAAYEEEGVAHRVHSEPSCTVLTRSAMALHMSAGDKSLAIGAFQSWLQMQCCCGEPPPKEIVVEIADILRQIADQITT